MHGPGRRPSRAVSRPPQDDGNGRDVFPVLAPWCACEWRYESFEISPDARRARRLPSVFAALSKAKKGKQNADRRCVRHLRAVLPARDAPLSLSPRPLARERLRGGAPRLSAFHRGSRQRDASPKGSGPGQASWDLVSAGVTRGRLSQSSGSTPRTGRNAGEHDARTRPGAECMAPRASTAPAPPSRIPSRKASVSERDLALVIKLEAICQ